MKKIKWKKNNKAFTLVEALIAIAILMISVAAPLSLASKGLQASMLAKQQITAFYLAQDAYEWVKNKADYNKQNFSDIEALAKGFDNCLDGKSCVIKTKESPESYNPESYGSSSSLLNLYFDSVDGSYGYDNSKVKTIFQRYVKIKKITDPNAGDAVIQLKVSVVVQWKPPFANSQKYELNGVISNW